MNQTDLTQQASHFAFGKNWAAYAEKVTAAEIDEAVNGLMRLTGGARMDGQRFLDIGCGSGLHSLAALLLGAREVVALDIDPDSVATTQAVLVAHAADRAPQCTVATASVFDLEPDALGVFDVVYSWGVLHHTGAMERAIRCAASLVAPGGMFIFALYRRTWMDAFWKWEKRWYAQASSASQSKARRLYVALFRVACRMTGRSFDDYVSTYRANRGMDYYHDVHDWMGGWPYETIAPAEVDRLMRELGFEAQRTFVRTGRVFGRHSGVFGSGCDEFVYRRVA